MKIPAGDQYCQPNSRFSIEGVGSFIFDDIKGSYFNVLGLPTARLKEMFCKLGVDILKEIGRDV